LNQLIQQAKQGDNKALNTLINNHRDFAYSIALNVLKNKADAEDIVQNSFVIVLKSLRNFKNESRFSTWLYKIVYRESLRAVKQKKKRIDYSSNSMQPEMVLEESNNEDINIKTLLNALSEKEYLVISLFYLKEKSINDIIKITALSKANIKVLLHRGRQKMKQSLINKS